MPACCQGNQSCADNTHSNKAVSRRVALVGNPNCGKPTLFNALTGARQYIGNWPGVTVERHSGYFVENGETVELVDLPGTYSLTILSESAAPDVCVACDLILTRHADVIVNVVDASNLERHLYLTVQLLEQGLPVILAVNMMDVARARGVSLDLDRLAAMLGCPVVAIEASVEKGLAKLKQAIRAVNLALPVTPLALPYPAALQDALVALQQSESCDSSALAIRLLEEEMHAQKQVEPAVLANVKRLQADISHTTGEDADILLAETRYQFIQHLLQQVVQQTTTNKTTWTERIDRVVLNRWLGIPIFLSVMYLLFVFAIDVGGYFQSYFDRVSEAVFVDGLTGVLSYFGASGWLIALLANGVGKGISTVVTFIPVIGAMFLFLALLEDSGYMARAAFVVDRVMGVFGLPGKAFVPMIVGFGCNVPAVMATRTLEHQRDRILAILMTPFMSCGARLAIFSIFAAAFFPHGGQNIVFLLYLIGMMMAMVTAVVLQKTLLAGEPAPLIMELPAYHIPQRWRVVRHAWQRLQGFVFRAGKLIVPICVLIGVLNTLNVDGTITSNGGGHSLLAALGQWMTPAFAPMGIQADNWPATVGLVTGVMAKEVVIGTLNALYTQAGQIDYGVMVQHFDGKIGAFAYLLFVLLYFPCVSTLAVMLKEMHRGWTLFSAAWMIGAAYGVAVIFYQAATWLRHPASSTAWIVLMLTLFLATVATLRWMVRPTIEPVGEAV